MIKMIINADIGKDRISKDIYGSFAEHLGRCIYEGIWVGTDSSIPNQKGIRSDVVKAIKELQVPVLRWPGGCFADEYHWQDGIGPQNSRPVTVNRHWGNVSESNHFGTHEFLDLCEMTGAEPYICGNVGNGTIQEMHDWIEYITFDGSSMLANLRRKNGKDKAWHLKYFGVGNENWGCGGMMRPEYYADLYRRYGCFVGNFSGNKIYRIACGSNGGDYHWTEVLMRECGNMMEGLSLHYYTNLWGITDNHSATQFTELEWFHIIKRTLFMEELISKHSAIMDKFDPQKKVGLIVDEWGTWHYVEPGTNPSFLYQQSTLRDALVAGINLNIFNNHCDRVRMANIAQTINVLQAVILTDKEKMILTPTYHIFNMYKVHYGALLLPVKLQKNTYTFEKESICQLHVSASIDEGKKIHITICNTDPEKQAELAIEFRGMAVSKADGTVLTADKINSHNTFDKPDNVKPGIYSEFSIKGNSKLLARIPSKSVVVLGIK